MNPKPSSENQYLIEHAKLLINSFHQLLGYPLVSANVDETKLGWELFHSKFALLSHTNAKEPIFNYSNQTALDLFELSWEELMTLPSRLSAEPLNQIERARLLEQVTEHGYINNYEGVRISKTGKRFVIHNAIVWNLLDANGNYQGQAACFSDWEFI